MRNDATVKVEARGEREILITRDFNAPAQVVFEAWTKPEHVRHWRGCFGSTMTACEIDLRPGGAWRHILRMPDGSEHPFRGVYREITPPQRLVYSECYDMPGIGSPEWLTTVTFEERDCQTKLTMTLLHGS